MWKVATRNPSYVRTQRFVPGVRSMESAETEEVVAHLRGTVVSVEKSGDISAPLNSALAVSNSSSVRSLISISGSGQFVGLVALQARPPAGVH